MPSSWRHVRFVPCCPSVHRKAPFHMSTPDILGTVARLGLDVLSMLLLVGWLYRRRLAAPEMTLVFTALNIGLFAAVTSIGSAHFPTGIGFGLFGLLSLVRLRSAAFTLKDVAYTFVALVLALVNGLPGPQPGAGRAPRRAAAGRAVGGRRDPARDPGDPADAGHPGHRRHRPGGRRGRGAPPDLGRAAQRRGRGRRPGPRHHAGGRPVRRAGGAWTLRADAPEDARRRRPAEALGAR